MKQQIIWGIACQIYKHVLRGLLMASIDDPETEWDDWVLSIADNIFNYESE